MGIQLTTVVKNLLIINGIMFLLKLTFGTDELGRNLLDGMLGMHSIGSPHFKPWQIVTHMFMHADFMHLFVNMFGLFMFGVPLERLWGPKRFLIYYLVTGLGAVALHMGVNQIELSQHMAAVVQHGVQLEEIKNAVAMTDISLLDAERELDRIAAKSGAPMSDLVQLFWDYQGTIIGASGAVFGILLAFGMIYPNSIIMLIFPPIPLKAKYFVIIYGLIELGTGLAQRPGDNIAHFAHLGGMVFGFFLLKHWQQRPEN